MFLAGRPSQDSNRSLNNIRLLCRPVDNYIGAMAGQHLVRLVSAPCERAPRAADSLEPKRHIREARQDQDGSMDFPRRCVAHAPDADRVSTKRRRSVAREALQVLQRRTIA